MVEKVFLGRGNGIDYYGVTEETTIGGLNRKGDRGHWLRREYGERQLMLKAFEKSYKNLLVRNFLKFIHI